MQSRHTEEGEREALEKWAPLVGEDLALRVYTSRLLGADPALVLHGGGNTSVKTTVTELTGETTRVLAVKGSGWDLSTIEPRGFPACRLERLVRAAKLREMTDEQMVAELRGQMIDPTSPTPSVEALLHAVMPAKFVDHTHADAVLACVDQPDSARIVREIWGDRALVVPYVMPGFVLARAIVERLESLDSVDVVVLDKHGIFTWGETARESYERMIAAVDRAERWIEGARRPRARARAAADATATLERLAPVLRGALARAGAAEGRDARMVCLATTHADVVALASDADAGVLSQMGPITPDHVIRTKPWPLLLPESVTTAADDEALATIVDAEVARYVARYRDYVARASTARAREVAPLDPLPRAVLVPGAGALALGATAADASIVRDIVEHTAGVVLDAAEIGAYRPVDEGDLFDVEYWSLEQAKLALAPAAKGALARRIALVTGAASGIGRATAEAMLTAGAHVVLVDRDAARLSATHAELARKHARRVASFASDLVAEGGTDDSIAAAVRAFGGLDVVVSNAGDAPTGLLHEPEGEARLEASLALNLLSHQRVARAAARVMLRQRTGGCLLFNASKSAFNQGPNFGPYAVPKAALVALMRQYAVDLGARGIRANAVNADRIRTDLFGGGVLETRARARGVSVDEYFRANLLGRETTGRDVAEAFVYLAAAEATTGCVVTVDGGNPAAFPR